MASFPVIFFYPALRTLVVAEKDTNRKGASLDLRTGKTRILVTAGAREAREALDRAISSQIWRAFEAKHPEDVDWLLGQLSYVRLESVVGNKTTVYSSQEKGMRTYENLLHTAI